MSLPLKIFINYRRADRPELVKKIRDELALRYDDENVFMDLDIPNFSRFIDHLEEKVKEADVLLAFIGPKWLELLNDRADSDEEDILVKEIEQALRQEHTMVATICIGGANRPSRANLPVGIQNMLDFQIPQFFVGGDFLEDVRQVTADIEREFERRGVDRGNVQDLDSIVRLPPSVLETHVFELLEEDNMLRVEKNLREFPSILLDTMSNGNDEERDVARTLVESFAVFGVVFIKYNRNDLFMSFVSSMHRAFESAYKRFSSNTGIDQITASIWNELLKKLYFLGALALAEGRIAWIPHLLSRPIPRDLGHRVSYNWIEYMQRKRNVPDSEVNRLLLSIVEEIKIPENGHYFYDQFLRDEETLTNYICQFDFTHCLFVDSDLHERKYSGAWPYFLLYYLDRIVPIMERMIIDVEFRNSLLGCHLSNTKLASSFARYCLKAQHIQQQGNTWMRGLWNYSAPQVVLDFLNTNLSQDEKTRLRYW